MDKTDDTFMTLLQFPGSRGKETFTLLNTESEILTAIFRLVSKNLKDNL